MTPGPYADDLLLALALADAVDAVTLPNFATGELTVETKPDDTPVTAVDRAAERTARDLIAQHRPDDAFVGEEYGTTGTGARRWVVDPIDGTKNFIRDVPVWATLIALLDGDDAAVGVVSAPALGRRWFAARGQGAWLGASEATARRITVSDVASLDQASLSYSDLAEWREFGRLDQFLGLIDSVWRTRAYGDFWSYMMVAEGAVDIATEPELALYDMAALVAIVEEAGGRFTGVDGTPGPHGGNALVTNGLLHDEVMRRLA
ncbi:histidinol-phosphatase [Demequina sp. SYSU T00039]|uniref:Histidinol-phosphatase n=1 Tax=Demequina lignilytica TaxID=3051663 RepID=A0AAW7M6L5_9MICO|nr:MULTISPECIES: histidinol-phosphatase [unclassified Demequina]MDN4478292.1 histidinol-phosphatase [Demequina sp. SYSU T00039-1]MDN4489092.1 histidinol-phosphatase [Demequina sp. SYSU T00039]